MSEWKLKLRRLKNVDSVVLYSRRVASNASPEETKEIIKEADRRIQQIEIMKISKDYKL